MEEFYPETYQNESGLRIARTLQRLFSYTTEDALYADFDVRRYGYSLLSKFLETFPKLKLIQEGTKVSVTLYEDKSKKERLEEYIIQQIRINGRYGISLGSLGNRIRMKFGDFKVRDYGFSQFKQYIQSFPQVELEDDGERTRAVYVGE